MKYFCPLENVKTIKGRSNNEVNDTSTNINGWEIASNGIWAGGKDSNTIGKGKKALGIFSQNWSIGSDGGIVANNITANGNLNITKQICFNNFILRENKEDEKDIFEIMGKYNNNNFKILKIKRKDTSSFNTYLYPDLYTQQIFFYAFYNNKIRGYTTAYEDCCFAAGVDSTDHFRVYNEAMFNLKNNIIESSPDGETLYEYKLPEKNGEVIVVKNFINPDICFFNIEIKENFYFGYFSYGHDSTSSLYAHFYSVGVNTIYLPEIFRDSGSIEIQRNIQCKALMRIKRGYEENSTVKEEIENKLVTFNLKLTNKNGIITSEINNITGNNMELTVGGIGTQENFNNFILHKYNSIGEDKQFIYSVATKTWKEQK